MLSNLQKTRCEGVILKDNKILLIYCKKNGHEYYVLPGGSLEKDETLENCVTREITEETSITSQVNKLLYIYNIKDDTKKYIFLCDYISGQPKIGNGNEKIELENNSSIQYIPQWFPIDELKNIHLIYTIEFRDWFLENFNDINKINDPFILKISVTQQLGWRHK